MSAEAHEHPIVGRDHQLPAPEPAKPRSKKVRLLVWVLILAVFALGFYLVLTRKNTPKPTRGRHRGPGSGPVTLTTATAQRGDIGVYLDSIGTVTPVYTATITSQVNGVIVAVHFREGQYVRKGEPLIDIDSRPYEATLMQAQGILERDQNVLAQAEMDLARYRDAWARNAIQKQTLDDQEKIVLQDQGTVKNDEGVVKYDQVQVGYCHIVAPFSGRVGLRLVDPGNVVQANSSTALAVVTQVQPITVVFTIPEDSLGEVQPQLRRHSKLLVKAFDRAGLKQIGTGNLLTLDNQIDTTTGTVKGRAEFDNKDGGLYPNEFVNTRLLVNQLHDVTLIPTAAIQHNGNVAFVYVVQNKVAHLKTIQTGVIDGLTAQVEGLNPGEAVATSSFEKLQDGSKVVISKTPIPVSTTGSNAP